MNIRQRKYCAIRCSDAPGTPVLLRGGRGAGGGRARWRGVGRQGPDPRRRPWQGRRREAGEEGADIKQELYVGMVVDRRTQRVALMASSVGGMDIEDVAARSPEKIHKVSIDPVAGLEDAEADDVARRVGIPEGSIPQARALLILT